MNESIIRAAKIIKESKSLIAVTGAGISVPSGIPDFRSKDGLWERFDPDIYANIEIFRKSPEIVWDMLYEMIDLISGAEPNKGHYALAKLEELGLLKAVITQNIDRLHVKAGSSRVIEYHGNTENMYCVKCGSSYMSSNFDFSKRSIPKCSSCGSVLKPAVIFFGETIPADALAESRTLAYEADAVMLIGTSAVVYPAAAIPILAKNRGAAIIEFNIEETEMTPLITDIFIKGSTDVTLPAIINELIN